MKKRTIVLCLCLFATLSVFAQTKRAEVENLTLRILREYPKATLADIYKTSFQDVFGPEHLVENPESVRNYLNVELKQMEEEKAKGEEVKSPYYEPCGLEGNFIRVYLSVLQDSIISNEQLADAFVRSSKKIKKVSLDYWLKEWRERCQYVKEMNLSLENFEKESLYIEQIIEKGHYAWVHSRIYHDTYHPHYRIIEREIFLSEILPLIQQKRSEESRK
ncbi:MAG: hypothetical protein KBT03_11425 [Bacteroidales bacterium]|nr:hypothetical protein [Candidatus Scybalousia scybalohippi]